MTVTSFSAPPGFGLADDVLTGTDVPVVVVRGELDLFTAPEFRRRLFEVLETAPRALVVDLIGCTFIDSAASAALLSASHRARSRSIALAIVVAHPALLKVFSIMGLDDLLTVVADREAAAVALTR